MSNPLSFPANAPANMQRASTATKTDAKIDKAATDFESLLLTNWLQSAEQSFGTVPGQESDEDPGKEQFQGFAMQSLGASLTKAGGIGLASTISAQLHKASASVEPQKGSQTQDSPPEAAPKQLSQFRG